MRHVDFAPFHRSTVGFDRLFQLLDASAGVDDSGPTYPPYNIERLGENEYRIAMAVAGFSKDEIDVEVKEDTLSVVGKKAERDEDKAEYLHRGIAARNFERRFQLADHVEVSGADLKDGMLNIDLVRNLPERMKPRSIPIGAGADTARQIEAQA